MCVMGSCASLGKGVFLKRKYNKGYHIDLASHKRSEPKTKVESRKKIPSQEEKEIVIVEKKTAETEQQEIQPEKEFTHGFTSHQSLFRSIGSDNVIVYGNVKQGLVKKITVFSAHKSGAPGSKFALGAVVFIILTLIYAFAIVIRNPGFPFGIALLIGMIGALLTVLTGRVFM